MIQRPEALLYVILRQIHKSIHYGRDATFQWLQKYIIRFHLQKTIKQVTKNCIISVKNKSKTASSRLHLGTQHKGNWPTEDWQINFTQMPWPVGNLRTFQCLWTPSLRRVKSFPTRTQKTSKVICMLLKETMPRFGLPNPLQKDKGPAFVSHLTQQKSKSLDV